MLNKHQNALEYANTWMDIIHRSELPDRENAQWIIDESIHNFSEHFNRGWLEQRKSVNTQRSGWAAVEWSGDGAQFTDVLGRKYIDFLGGYGLMSLGWSHPEVVEAVRSQLLCNPMPSQELIDPLRGALARIMADTLPGDISYSFFAASGTEANEGAIKLAKLYTGKSAFIAATDGFHGKTMGSLSMMGKAIYREPVGQLYGGPVYHIPFGNADALEQQLEICKSTGVGVAGAIFEPIQGEAGAIVPPDDFWPRARELTKAYGTLLIADEVQTGLGRTGELWGVDHWGVVPDIVTTGKALGGGVMPVSAFSSTPEIWESMMSPNPFIHTTTTGGGALACAAAIAAIRVVLRDNYPEQAREKGVYMKQRLQGLVEKHPNIYTYITGSGLLLGQHFVSHDIGYRVAAELFKRGVLVAGTLNSSKTIRIEPPIVITYAEIDEGLNRLEDALMAVSQSLL